MPEAGWFPAGLEAQLQHVHVAFHSQEATVMQMGEHSHLQHDLHATLQLHLQLQQRCTAAAAVGAVGACQVVPACQAGVHASQPMGHSLGSCAVLQMLWEARILSAALGPGWRLQVQVYWCWQEVAASPSLHSI